VHISSFYKEGYFQMRFIKNLLAGLLVLSLPTAPAMATDVIAAARGQNNIIAMGVVTATANYTNATTSESDITGATMTIPASRVTGATQYYKACYWADVGKATATTGTVRLYVNGSAVAAADRIFNVAAVRGSAAACYAGARPTNSSFIVKLRGVSGDTNTFTVYNATLETEVFFRL
jgi:hypothetical protein